MKKIAGIFGIIVALGAALLPTTARAGITIQGTKVNEALEPIGLAGSTVSLRGAPDARGISSFYGKSFGPGDKTFTSQVENGKYEVGAGVPDGYELFSSVCVNCVNHPPESFQPAPNPLVVEAADGYVDVWLMYKKKEVFGSEPPGHLDSMLTCNYNGVAIPHPTEGDTQSFAGSKVGATVAFNRFFGGIPVKLELFPAGDPSSGLDVLDAASAAGAAWQTSLIGGDKNTNSLIVWNQSAGNMAQQWGFGSGYDVSEKGIFQKSWNPQFSDHHHPKMSFTEPQINTTPCYRTGFRLNDAKFSLEPSQVSTDKGSVLRLENQFKVRSRMNQNWEQFMAEQALYLNRMAARSGDLRVYLIGEGGAWKEGPIRPNEVFPYLSTNARNTPACDKEDACYAGINAVDAVVLVWKVKGQDMAIGIRHPEGKSFYGSLALTKNVRCTGEDHCGNVEWHSWMEHSWYRDTKKSFKAGEVTNYKLHYEFGTMEQLEASGFHVAGNVKAPEGFFQPEGEGTIYRSDGSNAFCKFDHWEDFLAAGGAKDLSNMVRLPAGLPSGMRNDGSCVKKDGEGANKKEKFPSTPAPSSGVSGTLPENSPLHGSGWMQPEGDSNIYYFSQGRYCRKQGWDDFVNSGGTLEAVVPLKKAQLVGAINDGNCAYVPQPEGFFQIPGDGSIYYSNGKDAFCKYPHWENFLQAGGKANLANVKKMKDPQLPPAMRNDGNCGG